MIKMYNSLLGTPRSLPYIVRERHVRRKNFQSSFLSKDRVVDRSTQLMIICMLELLVVLPDTVLKSLSLKF